ncbi:MAG: DeoR/GlpR family DNA-binding transcription regulator [Promethearchaeota archaeon]
MTNKYTELLNHNERQKKILEILEINRDISVTELAIKFNVHQMTIRRDLKKLERKGVVLRTYGGAHIRKRKLTYLSNEDINLNIKKKNTIASYIIENIIRDGNYIFLDTGSTMLQIAKILNRKKRISIATNSIDIMAELYQQPEINSLILGGSLSSESSTLFGPYAIKRLKDMESKADLSFISCDGVMSGCNNNSGFYTDHNIDANLTPIALKIGAKKKCIAADSSKIGRHSLYKFAEFSDVDLFITDSDINIEILEDLKKYVDVVVAEIK